MKISTRLIGSILLIFFISAVGFSQTITLKQLWVKKASVSAMEFTSDGIRLVTGGIRSDNTAFGNINIWRVKDSVLLHTITDSRMGTTNDVDISKNDTMILSGHGSVECAGDGACGAVLPGLFKTSITGNIKKFLNDSGYIIPAIAYSPDNTMIAAGTNFNNTGNIHIYDSAFHLKRVLQNHVIETASLKFTPDGKYLVSGNDSNYYGSVKIWDYKTGKLIRNMANGDYVNGGGAAPQIDVSPNSQYIASGGGGYNMATRIWRVSDGKLIFTLPINSGDYTGSNAPKFSPDGNYIFSGISLYSSGIGWHGLIYIWRMSDGALVKTITDNYGSPQFGGVRTLAFSKVKNYFAYSVNDELKVFSLSGLTVSQAVAVNTGDAVQTNNTSFHATIFPNPVTTTANIRYSLSLKQKVSLSVYDAAGRKVADLVNGIKEAGNYTVLFNGAGLKAGVYIYKLVTENNSESGKIILGK